LTDRFIEIRESNWMKKESLVVLPTDSTNGLNYNPNGLTEIK